MSLVTPFDGQLWDKQQSLAPGGINLRMNGKGVVRGL